MRQISQFSFRPPFYRTPGIARAPFSSRSPGSGTAGIFPHGTSGSSPDPWPSLRGGSGSRSWCLSFHSTRPGATGAPGLFNQRRRLFRTVPWSPGPLLPRTLPR
jgi:hypothetical protein